VFLGYRKRRGGEPPHSRTPLRGAARTADSRYTRSVADLCYLSVWCEGVDAQALPALFEKFLATASSSPPSPAFSQLVLRALSWAETPLIEQDLRQSPLDAAGVLAAVRESLTADSCCEVETHWDLWTFDSAKSEWTLGPQRLEIACHGPEFDEGFCSENGHFRAGLGFEHLFTGDPGLPGGSAPEGDAAKYRENTRDNVRRLERWMRRIALCLPVKRMRVWSECEENLEARFDAILAAH
jgi:hypothetical protein